jgi:hypothetical protein
MPRDTAPAAIVSARGAEGLEQSEELAFQPLALLPPDVPQRWKAHYQKLAARSAGSYRAAVTLKCLECVAWYRPEAARCEIATCPLWALNRRIFAAKLRDPAASTEGEAP